MDECCSESWVRAGCHLQSSGVGSEWLGPSRLWNCQTAVAPTLVLGGPQWRPGEGPKADLPQHPAWKSREDSHPPSVYIEKSMEKRERTIGRDWQLEAIRLTVNLSLVLKLVLLPDKRSIPPRHRSSQEGRVSRGCPRCQQRCINPGHWCYVHD